MKLCIINFNFDDFVDRHGESTLDSFGMFSRDTYFDNSPYSSPLVSCLKARFLGIMVAF